MRFCLTSLTCLLAPPPSPQLHQRACVGQIRAVATGPPPSPPPLIDPADLLRAGPDAVRRLLSPEARELQKELAELTDLCAVASAEPQPNLSRTKDDRPAAAASPSPIHPPTGQRAATAAPSPLRPPACACLSHRYVGL